MNVKATSFKRISERGNGKKREILVSKGRIFSVKLKKLSGRVPKWGTVRFLRRRGNSASFPGINKARQREKKSFWKLFLMGGFSRTRESLPPPAPEGRQSDRAGEDKRLREDVTRDREKFSRVIY